MVVICEAAGGWRLPVTTLELPLEKGVQLRLDAGAMVGPTGKPLERKGEVVCRLLAWQYRVARAGVSGVMGAEASPATMDLELLVEEMPAKWFGPWLERQYQRLSPDNQFFAPMMMALFIVVITAVVMLLIYVSPHHGLAFVGRYVRRALSWLILLLFLWIIPTKLGLLRNPQTFRKNFFFALMNFTGYVLTAWWLHFSIRPEGFAWSDQSLADYARGLGAGLSHSYWPLIAAALPWLSIGFRMFGFEFAEKTAEGFEKMGKKHE